MLTDRDDDDTTYRVVINDEEQYSIWPADRDNPPGWYDVGQPGCRTDCLAYIEAVWTDIRPLSLRQQLERRERELARADSTRGQ